jgi:hypothetical protein
MTVDAFGDVLEDVASPYALGGPSYSVAAAGNVVVAATTTPRTLRVWTIQAMGALAEAATSPYSTNVDLLRIAVSD